MMGPGFAENTIDGKIFLGLLVYGLLMLGMGLSIGIAVGHLSEPLTAADEVPAPGSIPPYYFTYCRPMYKGDKFQ